MEEEASPGDMIRDVSMDTREIEVVTRYQNQHCGEYRQCGGKFDKSPTRRNPRVNSKTKDADKDRCRWKLAITEVDSVVVNLTNHPQEVHFECSNIQKYHLKHPVDLLINIINDNNPPG